MSTKRWRPRRDLDDPRAILSTDNPRYKESPLMYEDLSWRAWPELTVKVFKLDHSLKTYDIHNALSKFGNIERIDFVDTRARNGKNAVVTFSPPPPSPFWERYVKLNFDRPELGFTRTVWVSLPQQKRQSFISIKNDYQKYPESMRVEASSLMFGSIHQPDTMMVMFCLGCQGTNVHLNLRYRQLIIHFAMTVQSPQPQSVEVPPVKRQRLTDTVQYRQYKIVIPIQQLKMVLELDSQCQEKEMVIPLSSPPEYFRRMDNIASSHSEEAHWQDSVSWLRQTEIRNNFKSDNLPLALQKSTPLIDIGRWTTFRLTFSKTSSMGTTYKLIRQALVEYNVEFVRPERFDFVPRPNHPTWTWINPSSKKAISDTELVDYSTHGVPELSWKVKYQLEACLSQDCLNEYNITMEFLNTLASLPDKRALEILEHVVETRKCYFDPMEVFQLKAPKTTSSLKLPPYCVLTRAVNITPTTIWMSSPTVEISNRILRKYAKYSDHFLRVRFCDEKNKGQVRSFENGQNDAIFTKFFRCLKDGITVGGKHFEFLASGNSQFRERGAYFFARTSDLSADIIRQNLGNFESIHTVSKFASRLGLAFSTTRSIQNCEFQIVRIEDVVKNGHNFTDGVGKISTSLAKLLTSELGYQSHNWNSASVFQFRLGGMKGVLAVDPHIGSQEIHIRDSQTKFPAEHEGLEVIRCSTFCAAYLNRQLILVLRSLRILDRVFLQKLKVEMDEFKDAMSDSDLAISKLTRHVDLNQMTTAIADILISGFMKTREPFAMTVLHLWRIHSMKNLKEKARLVVDKGAFLFGCTDETQTLRGYQKVPRGNGRMSQTDRINSLPEIFIQIDRNGDGHDEVVTGICIVARNPSLHPGDIRVVLAVDIPALHHLRNVVVFPQTGDRDIPSMCSGGDLDGDDFLVIWDPELIPPIWDEKPMHFFSPKSTEKEGSIEIDDVAKFFVNYMKRDSLRPIAVAHVAQADQLRDGIRDPLCLELAELHSKAVDYSKSGVPVTMTRRLQPRKYPHFLPNTFRPPDKIYQSNRLLGKMYDAVENMDFNPLRDLPFDDRILKAYPRDRRLELLARETKEDYDAALQRIMSQHEIETEFEVWTTFALKHAGICNDYSFHEEIGRLSRSLRARFQTICYEKVGSKEFEVIAPMVAAMYRVTSDEVTNHLEKLSKIERLKEASLHVETDQDIGRFPFISFPWIFYAELGRIAREGRRMSSSVNRGSEDCSIAEKDCKENAQREESQLEGQNNGFMDLDMEPSPMDYKTPPEYPSPCQYETPPEYRSTTPSGTCHLHSPKDTDFHRSDDSDGEYDCEEGEILVIDMKGPSKWEIISQDLDG